MLDAERAREIPLTQGKVTLVDSVDYEPLSRFTWCAVREHKTFYAARTRRVGDPVGPITIRMHREILGVSDPRIQVDHCDGDGLNNRRDNLRPCSNSQNQQNGSPRGGTSRFKGVWWHKTQKTWLAAIRVPQGERRHLGRFKEERDAAMAYDKAACELFREFARPNFSAALAPPEEE